MIPTLNTILYATGLEPHAPRVFRYAVSLARQYDARIVLVHAMAPLAGTTRTLVESYLPPQVLETLRERGHDSVAAAIEDHLTRFCAAEAGDDPAARDRVAEIRLEEGQPAEVILEAAAETGADVIVMGSHAHSAVGEVLLGSVAHRVVQHAPVPVLLVRIDTEAGTR